MLVSFTALESYRSMKEHERDCYPVNVTTCYHCGRPCSGDTTERIDIDGYHGEAPVCDTEDGSSCEPVTVGGGLI